MEAVQEVVYENGVTLHAKTAAGWQVTEADGTSHTFSTIMEFIRWCRENYSWPMV